jgi:hypothetical protein
LSPKKEGQLKKDLDKASADPGKLKQRIADKEALLAKYKQ